MALRAAFRWRIDPRSIPRDITREALPLILTAYLLDTKAKAGGPLRRSAPRARWPVLTGRSIESLHWSPLRARTPILRGVRYARFVNRRGDNLLQRAWDRFAESPRFERVLRRAVRNIGRAP